jgi:hypothetical protein
MKFGLVKSGEPLLYFSASPVESLLPPPPLSKEKKKKENSNNK